MKITLPAHTPLLFDPHHGYHDPMSSPGHHDHPQMAVVNGQVVIQEALSFPKYYIPHYDFYECLLPWKDQFSSTQWKHMTNSSWMHDKIPILLVDGKLETDTDWLVFSALEMAVFNAHITSLVLKNILSGMVKWNTHYPTPEGGYTAIVLLIELAGWRTENMDCFIGRSRDVAYCKEMDDIFKANPLTDILKTVSKKDLQQFNYQTKTLLDLACDYHLWSLADWLWGAGVRWSKEYVKSGHLFKCILDGCFELSMERNIQSFPSGSYEKQPELSLKNERDHVWLKTWLDRYRSLKDYPIKLKVDFRYQEQCRHRRIDPTKGPKRFVDKAVEYWIFRFLKNHIQSSELEDQRKTATWFDFWFSQGIDFKQVKPYLVRPDHGRKQRISFDLYIRVTCSQADSTLLAIYAQQERFEFQKTFPNLTPNCLPIRL